MAASSGCSPLAGHQLPKSLDEIELWLSGYNGVESSEGNQHAELNSRKADAITKRSPSEPGATYGWQIDHLDVFEVIING